MVVKRRHPGALLEIGRRHDFAELACRERFGERAAIRIENRQRENVERVFIQEIGRKSNFRFVPAGRVVLWKYAADSGVSSLVAAERFEAASNVFDDRLDAVLPRELTRQYLTFRFGLLLRHDDCPYTIGSEAADAKSENDR